jgi:hypothetical protein
MQAAEICERLAGMRHHQLLLIFATAIAIELVHLRWIVLTQWHCRGCRATHGSCACRYGWLKRLL